MTQSQQTAERRFFAVDFRGVQPASRERTALSVVGDAGLEIIAGLPAALPVPAEVEAGGRVTLGLGGEAARAAFAYAALGGLVRLFAAVGEDAAGEVVLRWLAARGAGTEGVRRGGRTPISVLVWTAGCQPLAIQDAEAVPGAAIDAGALSFGVRGPRSAASGQESGPWGVGDDVRGRTSDWGTSGASGPERRSQGEAPAAPLAARGGTLLLAGYPYARGLRGEGAVQLLRAARAQGLRAVVSLAPVALGGLGPPLAPADLEGMLPHVDLICGGGPELRRATRRADAYDAARALIGGGARAVLAKRGPEGASVFRPGPAALEREDTSTPAAVSGLPAADPLRRAAAFGAVYDAAYLLGVALNDGSPARFAAAAAARAAASDQGVLGI